METSNTKTKRNALLIGIAVIVVLSLAGVLYAKLTNWEAVGKAYAFYKKEIYKEERDEINSKIQTLDDKYFSGITVEK